MERTGGAGGWFGFAGGGSGVFVGVWGARRGRGEGFCAWWGVVPRMLMSLPHAPKRVAWVWFPARVTIFRSGCGVGAAEGFGGGLEVLMGGVRVRQSQEEMLRGSCMSVDQGFPFVAEAMVASSLNPGLQRNACAKASCIVFGSSADAVGPSCG